jgi:hypothetical protein
MLTRTAKSCRSGAPMQASSLREEAQATVSNKRGHRGEREVSRKTIAQGMPGVSGVTVVTTLVCLFFYTRGCGRIARPAFPAPSEGERFLQNSGASRREIAESYFEFGVPSLRGAKRRSNPPFVIPGWSEGPDLRCAIAHRGISRFRARCFASTGMTVYGLLRGACHRAYDALLGSSRASWRIYTLAPFG